MSKIKIIYNYLTNYPIEGVLETNTKSLKPINEIRSHHIEKKINANAEQKMKFPIRNFTSKEILNEKLHVLCSKINYLISI